MHDETLTPDALFRTDLFAGVDRPRYMPDKSSLAGPLLATSAINLTVGGLLTWGAIAALGVGTAGWIVLGAILAGFAFFSLSAGLLQLVGGIAALC